MATYRIENRVSGADLGLYSGEDALSAYNAMLDDAGEARAQSIPDDIMVSMPSPLGPVSLNRHRW